jgi:hypothetical protein
VQDREKNIIEIQIVKLLYFVIEFFKFFYKNRMMDNGKNRELGEG